MGTVAAKASVTQESLDFRPGARSFRIRSTGDGLLAIPPDAARTRRLHARLDPMAARAGPCAGPDERREILRGQSAPRQPGAEPPRPAPGPQTPGAPPRRPATGAACRTVE